MRPRPTPGSVPHSWLLFPKISGPFQLQYRPNIYLFALKTPLPAHHQVHFRRKHLWTLDLAIGAACEKIKHPRVEVSVTSIETSPPFDWMDPQECVRLCVAHHYRKVDDDYPLECLEDFCRIVHALPPPGFIQIVLVSSHNGINRPGFLIAGFLTMCQAVQPRKAIALFRQRHSGIYSPLVASRLDPGGDSGAQAEIVPENPDVHWNTGLSPLPTAEAVHMLPTFGGVEVADIDTVCNIQRLIQGLRPDAGLRAVQADCFPIAAVWSRDRLDLLALRRFYCTYTPQGITVFFLVLESDSVWLYIPTGMNKTEKKLWKFPAAAETVVPVVCTGVLVEKGARPAVILTDLLRYGTECLARCELEDRLGLLWYKVIDNISDCPLAIRFRAVGEIAVSRMTDMDGAMASRYGFASEGLTLISHLSPAGTSFIIPTHPAIKLRVIFNTKEYAVLYAKSDDDGDLVPFWIRKTECESDYCLQGKTVRFDIQATAFPEVVFRPRSVSAPDTFDFVSYAQGILDFVRSGAHAQAELAECKKIIREA